MDIARATIKKRNFISFSEETSTPQHQPIKKQKISYSDEDLIEITKIEEEINFFGPKITEINSQILKTDDNDQFNILIKSRKAVAKKIPVIQKLYRKHCTIIEAYLKDVHNNGNPLFPVNLDADTETEDEHD